MNTAQTPLKWLTTAEAATHLRINRRTLGAWVRAGKVRGHALSGSARITWRFLSSELDAMLCGSSAVPADRRHS